MLVKSTSLHFYYSFVAKYSEIKKETIRTPKLLILLQRIESQSALNRIRILLTNTQTPLVSVSLIYFSE